MNTSELGKTLIVQARVNPAKEKALMDQIAAGAGTEHSLSMLTHYLTEIESHGSLKNYLRVLKRLYF